MLESSDKIIPMPAATNAPMPWKQLICIIRISHKRNPNQLETSTVNRKDIHMRVEKIGCRIRETINANGTLAIAQKRSIARIDLLFGGSINGASIYEAQRIAITVVNTSKSRMRNC